MAPQASQQQKSIPRFSLKNVKREGEVSSTAVRRLPRMQWSSSSKTGPITSEFDKEITFKRINDVKTNNGGKAKRSDQCEVDMQLQTTAGPVHVQQVQCMIIDGVADEFLF
ncbi:hypothetical protein CCR75_003510 [Bremia lactucae]|uniref:Uncharacterized protein n=1 Tax=Bremia lactucae TaxID=4779 RepID=A0A976IGY2_BRELC|nr:hypothetical protein CCR75_003510 [Bremia lactucae]